MNKYILIQDEIPMTNQIKVMSLPQSCLVNQ